MDDEANNSTQEASWTNNTAGAEASPEHVGATLGVDPQQAQTSLPSIQWSASEYVEHEKNSKWYLALVGGGVLLTGLIFLITQDYLASIVVLLAIISVAVFAGRKPETKQYSVDETVLKLGKRLSATLNFVLFL